MTLAIVTNVLHFSIFQKYFSLGLHCIEYKNVFDHKSHTPSPLLKNVIIVFMVKILHVCLFHSPSVFTLRVSSLFPIPLELIGLGKHPKQQYLDS